MTFLDRKKTSSLTSPSESENDQYCTTLETIVQIRPFIARNIHNRWLQGEESWKHSECGTRGSWVWQHAGIVTRQKRPSLILKERILWTVRWMQPEWCLHLWLMLKSLNCYI
jgi:hypothetical protein